MDGNLTHGARDLAESQERAAQAVVNLERAEDLHREIGEIHVVHRLVTGALDHPPRARVVRAEAVVN